MYFKLFIIVFFLNDLDILCIFIILFLSLFDVIDILRFLLGLKEFLFISLLNFCK